MASVIVKNPAVLSGEPVFRGTRVPFKALTDYLEGGESLAEFLEQYPSVTREAAIAALEGRGRKRRTADPGGRQLRCDGHDRPESALPAESHRA